MCWTQGHVVYMYMCIYLYVCVYTLKTTDHSIHRAHWNVYSREYWRRTTTEANQIYMDLFDSWLQYLDRIFRI